MMQDIIIAKGARVKRDDNEIIQLSGEAHVQAERQEDGGFIYTIGDHEYYTCAGVCSFYNHLNGGKYHKAIEPKWEDDYPDCWTM